MVDNVPITPGTGVDIATDDVGGVHLQRVKLDVGADGVSTPVVGSMPTNDDAAAAILLDIQTAAEAIQASAAAIDTDTTTLIGHVDGLETLVGTTNTTLTTIDGRVDGIETLLTAIDGHVDGIEGSVDGLETLVGTTNSTLTTIDGRVDGLETLIGTTNSTLTTIDGRVDGVEGLLTTIDGHVDGLETLVTSTNTKLDTIDGHVDGIETSVDGIEGLIGTTNTTLTTIDGRVDGLETLETDIRTSVQLIDDAIVADDATFTPATTKVMMAGYQADESSTDSIDEGDAGAARMTLDRKTIVTQQPHTAGGLSVVNNIDVDESEDDVKTSAGQLYSIYCYNAATTVRWLRFYNATAANTTVGSTATFYGPFGVPPGSAFTKDIPSGIAFDTAICVAATTGIAANDTGAPGTNDVSVVLGYK